MGLGGGVQDNIQDRNEDVRLIFRGIRFGNKELDMHMHNDHTIWMVNICFPRKTRSTKICFNKPLPKAGVFTKNKIKLN